MKLSHKFWVSQVPALLAVGMAMVFFSQQAVKRVLIEEREQKGRALLAALAKTTVHEMNAGNERHLLSLLSGAAGSADASYVFVTDPKGTVLAHTDVSQKGQIYLDSWTKETLGMSKSVSRLIVLGKSPVLDISYPLLEKGLTNKRLNSEEEMLLAGQQHVSLLRLGTLRMGLPIGSDLETGAKIFRYVLGVVFSMLVLLSFCSWALAWQFLEPVDRLARAAERIGQGAYGTTVPEGASDELGRLARAFNRMSVSLAQTSVSKEFLDCILENMKDPLMVLDEDQRIRMANSAAIQMLGYPENELLNRSATDIAPNLSDLIRSGFREGITETLEISLRTKKGELIPILLSASRFTDPQSNHQCVIAVAKDMRDRKKMEQNMRQTEKLTAVGRLASGVAHEINNPLAVMLGFAQGLLWDLPRGNAMEFPLRSIEREGLRCKHLVEELLTFSRVRSTDREPMDIKAAVEGAMALVEAQAHLNNIRVIKDLPSNLPKIYGNPNQAQQIVINLANNALDAMGEKGELTIRTRLIDDGSHTWVGLYVSDTGPGIPPDVLPRIFEPFFTTKPVGKGSGLGLGLAHEIMQKHSGSIEVASRPGFTEFCVKFPVRRIERVPEEPRI